MNSRRIERHTEEAVRSFIRRIARRYQVAGAVLYGSRARGTHRSDSDADVAVLLAGERLKVLKTTLAAGLARRMGAPRDVFEPGAASQHR
jgi:predicted nucleotidyltransferase